VHSREGADGSAYHAIVGSGKNSCVLHYSANSRVLQKNELVLIDFGPEVDHYTTDITRTWPCDGIFTKEMARLYDAVLEAQKAAIAVVRPGATIALVDAAANEVLEERGFARLVKHGTCHYIGMEVHDAGDSNARFVPGVAFTVEPGVYDEKTGLGVRIEDVVVVTEDGCEVLSSGAPKELAEIEALVREEGLLDRMDHKGG
jgi:Xaa-Pro aminopeptidase